MIRTGESLFDEEFEKYPGIKKSAFRSLLYGASVFFILVFIRPFGISDENPAYLFTACSGFGSVVFLWHMAFSIFIRRPLSRNGKNCWKLTDELLVSAGIFLCVSMSNF